MNTKNMIENKFFKNLPKKTQEIVTEMLFETFSDTTNDVVYADRDRLESIECESRSGFIPFDHNKGGVEIKEFTDLFGILGSGNYPNNKGARKEIERQIDYSLNELADNTFEHFKDLLESKGLTAKNCYYHQMQELVEKHKELSEVVKYIEDGESEVLGSDSSSIMYDMRFMYHGVDKNGVHRASVSAAVNTEGPYHRSHISWAPEVFCEGVKEVEIKWKNQKELKTALKKALDKVSKAVF